MAAAARVGDMHVCPQFSGNTPHVGGPINPPGDATVFIGGLPAACMGNACTCAAGPPDAIKSGSSSVMIGGKPAARFGDATVHGGKIMAGEFTVIIGD
jgi:uncharacterized Zn-binding protein involved in type VI secretion